MKKKEIIEAIQAPCPGAISVGSVRARDPQQAQAWQNRVLRRCRAFIRATFGPEYRDAAVSRDIWEATSERIMDPFTEDDLSALERRVSHLLVDWRARSPYSGLVEQVQEVLKGPFTGGKTLGDFDYDRDVVLDVAIEQVEAALNAAYQVWDTQIKAVFNQAATWLRTLGDDESPDRAVAAFVSLVGQPDFLDHRRREMTLHRERKRANRVARDGIQKRRRGRTPVDLGVEPIDQVLQRRYGVAVSEGDAEDSVDDELRQRSMLDFLPGRDMLFAPYFGSDAELDAFIEHEDVELTLEGTDSRGHQLLGLYAESLVQHGEKRRVGSWALYRVHPLGYFRVYQDRPGRVAPIRGKDVAGARRRVAAS